jgi:SAM-dependent methyltransferase
MSQERKDQETADKFANSWNNVYDPSVYTRDQFLDWVAPWTPEAIKGTSVMELGCGSGALLYHMAACEPSQLNAVDLGSSVETAKSLLGNQARIEVGDITQAEELKERFGLQDHVYSIGVLHHLTVPEEGVETLKAMTQPGGDFHGWVYAREGNAVVRWLVDPLRKLVNHFPWWMNKWLVAFPLTLPFFLYSKSCRLLSKVFGEKFPLPLFSYMLWIGQRGLDFHHHVAFDQLVTPMTHYIDRQRIERWLADDRVEPGSSYIIFRNGNSWKFGGKIKAA